MYYAIEYAYGGDVLNHGNCADVVHCFTSKAARARFVAHGPVQTTAAGYREAVRADHSYVRWAKREAAKGREWPIAL